MSTILNTNGTSVQVPVLNKKVAGKFYVITADWNSKITYALRDAAAGVLRRAGVEKDKIIQLSVPGTVELVNAAALALKTGKSPSASCSADATEGVIVIGCVIRGDTPHFDYVCQVAAQGVAELNAKGDAPVIFGVLTVNKEQEAIDRAGGYLGNKGAEAAVAAIEMANLHATIE